MFINTKSKLIEANLNIGIQLMILSINIYGDGERYHIFQYTNKNDINQSVNWESNKDKYIETEIDKVL
jgi:hypothetical protein